MLSRSPRNDPTVKADKPKHDWLGGCYITDNFSDESKYRVPHDGSIEA